MFFFFFSRVNWPIFSTYLSLAAPTAWLSQGHVRIQSSGREQLQGIYLLGCSYHPSLGIIRVWWSLLSGFPPGHRSAEKVTLLLSFQNFPLIQPIRDTKFLSVEITTESNCILPGRTAGLEICSTSCLAIAIRMSVFIVKLMTQSFKEEQRGQHGSTAS